MSKIRSLSFPDTNAIDMSGGRFEIYSSEIIDTSWGGSLAKGFGSNWSSRLLGDVTVLEEPYRLKMDGGDPRATFEPNSNSDLIPLAVGLYGIRFKFNLGEDSDSGVVLKFLSNSTGSGDQDSVGIYFSPLSSGPACYVRSNVGGVDEEIGFPIDFIDFDDIIDLSVLFFEGGGFSARYNGAEIFKRDSGPFFDVYYEVDVIVDGGPYPAPSFFMPISLYVKPYIENKPSHRHPLAERFQIIPDNIQKDHISFPFVPTRPGSFKLRLHGTGDYAGQGEDFDVEVIDNYSQEDNLRFLVSPVEKMYHDSEGLLTCRTHGVRRVDNAGSLTARMECICDGTSQDSDAVHVDVSKGGGLKDTRLGQFPEFFMVDKTDPVQPKRYGRDYQFLRIHHGSSETVLTDPDENVRHVRTLILNNGNRLYYGVKYKPEESLFRFSVRLGSNDSNLVADTVRAVRMSDATLHGAEEAISLPTALNMAHSVTLPGGIWLIEADFKQADSNVGVNSRVSMSVEKTSPNVRKIGDAVAFVDNVPQWGEFGWMSKGIRVSTLVEAKETVGSFFFILADRCGGIIEKHESPYYDIDTYTESFSAIEEQDGGVRFFYLEYDGGNIQKDLCFRKIDDLRHPSWWNSGKVSFQTSVHSNIEQTGFHAFDMVRRDNQMVDLVFSQSMRSDYYYSNDNVRTLYPAALAPNVAGDYKTVSLNMDGWISGLGVTGMVMLVDYKNVSYRSLPSVTDKRWRGAYFYKDFLTDADGGKPDPYRIPLQEMFYSFKPTACFIRAGYDRDSNRTIVSMLKSGDRVPFLISGKGGIYSDLASVDTDRDAVANGLMSVTGGGTEEEVSNFVFRTPSGTGVRSVDSAFGPDGYVYTVCTAYNAYQYKVISTPSSDTTLNTGADRYNTWLTIIDPLILTTSGSKVSPDATGFAKGQAQSVVPMFNMYGGGVSKGVELFTSISIVSDGQYLVTGIGSVMSNHIVLHQGTSQDTHPMSSVMDEVWMPGMNYLDGWEVYSPGITPEGVAIVGSGEYVARTRASYVTDAVKKGGGAVFYARVGVSGVTGGVVWDVHVESKLSGRGSVSVTVDKAGGGWEVNLVGATVDVDPIPVEAGVYDIYIAIEDAGFGSTTMPYTVLIKRADHAESAKDGGYKYDFRRGGRVVRGETLIRHGLVGTETMLQGRPGGAYLYEMGWTPLNNKRHVRRGMMVFNREDGVDIRSFYPSRGLPNLSKIGEARSTLSVPFPSLPFTMANLDSGPFRKHHWPNGFMFWPESGTTMKGDSIEISRQVVYRENASPSSRIHSSWRSAGDEEEVQVWADAHDSGMDTFSIDAFLISGANVPFVTVMVKDREEDTWVDIGVIDLVRYRFEEMRRQVVSDSPTEAVYAFDGLSFNLGKFEDVDHYLHPLGDRDVAHHVRSEKITKARFEKVWTDINPLGGGLLLSRDPRWIFSSRGVLKLEQPIERRFVGFRFEPWSTYEGYFKFDSLDFGVLNEIPLLYNHDTGSGLKSVSSSKSSFVEDNQVFSLQNEGIDREFNFRYSIADGALFMKFVSLIDRLTFSRDPVWIVENHKSKKDSIYLCLMSGDATTQILVDEDGDKFYNIDLKFNSVRRDS